VDLTIVPVPVPIQAHDTPEQTLYGCHHPAGAERDFTTADLIWERALIASTNYRIPQPGYRHRAEEK